MERTFDGLHVVVTGGTGALGAAVVARLAGAGAKCRVTCLHERELEGFDAPDGTEIVRGVDLSDDGAVANLYGAFGEGRPLWASLNVAGGFGMAKIADATADHWRDMHETNARSCFLCCREAVNAIRRSGTAAGRIVNVAARPALRPEQGAGMSAYAASKAAVAALTGALAEELKAEGILVNAVAPSIMDTPANRKAMPKADHHAWAKVEDVAETIAFLASPENRVTSGSVTPVYARA